MKQLKKIHLIVLFIIVFIQTVNAQHIKSVHGEYTYYVPENITLDIAKQTALQRAKVQALENEFGTVIMQNNLSHIENINGKSDIDFLTMGSSEVKGEWIENTEEPTFDITYVNNQLVVKCFIKGKAREILTAKPEFVAKVLRNGTTSIFESDSFKSGDDLFLSFKSPINGYLNVYLYDGNEHIVEMLPYRSETIGSTSIEGNHLYVFFSSKDATKGNEVDEYTITCNNNIELNQIILVFSENPFNKAISNDGLIEIKTFQKWLSKLKAQDKKAYSQIISIQVEP